MSDEKLPPNLRVAKALNEYAMRADLKALRDDITALNAHTADDEARWEWLANDLKELRERVKEIGGKVDVLDEWADHFKLAEQMRSPSPQDARRGEEFFRKCRHGFPLGKCLEATCRPAPAAQREEWLDPSEAMLSDWRFEAIWQAIKKWDINVPGAYEGYMEATGNHARAILDSLNRAEGPALHKIEEEKTKTPAKVWMIAHDPGCIEAKCYAYLFVRRASAIQRRKLCAFYPFDERMGTPTACRIVAYVPATSQSPATKADRHRAPKA